MKAIISTELNSIPTSISSKVYRNFPRFYRNLSNVSIERERAKKRAAEIIKSVHVPYNKGKAYFYFDEDGRKLSVHIPVKRITRSVGGAVLDIQEKLEKEFKELAIEVHAERVPMEFWGIPVRYLVEVSLKRA